MLKVIDLDHPAKDRDAFIFTLTVGGDKIGVTEEELSDLIRAKAGGSKGKKGRKAQGTLEGDADLAAAEQESAGHSSAWNGRVHDAEGQPLA